MLIETEEVYCLDNLDYTVREFVKKRLKPVPEQTEEEFKKEFNDEVLLEKAYRCRVMANKWEREALGELKKTIELVYGN